MRPLLRVCPTFPIWITPSRIGIRKCQIIPDKLLSLNQD